MAQLDKIIQAMLGQPGSEIALAANVEPQLHAHGGAPPHVLINRKIAAPLLRRRKVRQDIPSVHGLREFL